MRDRKSEREREEKVRERSEKRGVKKGSLKLHRRKKGNEVTVSY